MSFKGPKIAINDISGNIAKINTSGAVLVEATVNVGAVTTAISGQTLYIVSGHNTVQLTSGFNTVVTSISGNVVDTSVSGNVIKISGETVAFSNTQIIGKVSGETVIALISGQTVEANVDLSGVTLNVDSITVDISGQVVKAEVSGQKVRIGDSGFSYVQLQAFDYTNTAFRNVASDSSGVLSVTASVSANISGQTVRTFRGSGQNAVYITNQSGNVAASLDDGGRLLVTNSGIPVVGKISGETVIAHLVGGNNSVRLSSGFNAVQLFSGTNLVREAEPFNVFTNTTLLITGASGGIALLSGECSKVTIRNIGDSGTVMFVGYSGSNYAPWVASGQSWPMFSGAGFWMRDGDAATFAIPQARTSAVLRVVSHTSGARVSYMGTAY